MAHPAENEPPIAELLVPPGNVSALGWPQALERLQAADFYWLATVRPDGRPHVAPLLGVWVDGALHFSAGSATRKARNLAFTPDCVVTADSDGAHFVLEGRATQVRDAARLQRVASGYAAKYDWRVTVRDGALHGEGAPTAGPPPYRVYQVSLAVLFTFPKDDSFGATRWRF
jgi:hypothetical protein